MKLSKRLVAAGVGVLAAASLAGAGTAAAAFPDFSDCPTGAAGVNYCINIQSRTGYLDIKGFSVPIGESFQIRGGYNSATQRFTPPVGKTGIFAKPIQVPGGILGIDFPLPGNAVTATAQLAGTPSQIDLTLFDQTLRVPLKLALTNPLIGPGCQIGSNSNPVWLKLITGTTNPPPPNRPISGNNNVPITSPSPDVAILQGVLNVDNAFSVPGASGCGIGLGLINSLINLKLKIPSAAGNNTMVVGNDVGLKVL